MSNSTRIAVAVGTPQIVPVRTLPVSIAALPGPGGSIRVEYTLSPRDGGPVTWFPWPAGDVTGPTDDAITSPASALRFTALVAAGFVELCE